jgi:hypothetical protein
MNPNRIQITFFNVNNSEDQNVAATLGLHILSIDLFLSKCKLVKKKDGTFYVAPPSEEYICKKTGKKKYQNYFWFGSKTSAFFQKECLKAISSYCEEKKIENPMY